MQRQESKLEMTAAEYFQRGLECSEQERRAEAIPYYTQVIALAPDFLVAYLLRGAAYDEDRLAESIADFSQAITLDPNFYFPYYNRGFAYFEQKQFTKAIADFSRVIALTLMPDAVDACAVYFQQARLAKTSVDYSRRLPQEITSAAAEAYYYRGLAYRQQGQFAEAFVDFYHAITLKSEYLRPVVVVELEALLQEMSVEGVLDLLKSFSIRDELFCLKHALDFRGKLFEEKSAEIAERVKQLESEIDQAQRPSESLSQYNASQPTLFAPKAKSLEQAQEESVQENFSPTK